jgi:hypothetical protein
VLRTRRNQGDSIPIRLQEDDERPEASSDSEEEFPLPLPSWQNVGYPAPTTPSLQVLQSLLGASAGQSAMVFDPFAQYK